MSKVVKKQYTSYEITFNQVFKGKSFKMSTVVTDHQVKDYVEMYKKNKSISNINVQLYIPET